ncbi:hypothetical protein FACS189413_11090 [Bacteroidia bacterium]|nr:hypothetical protein FACS189413_11090 [Bacteroidia bacterium]
MRGIKIHDDAKTRTNNEGERFLGAAVGPYANRIAKRQFSIDGTEYQLPLNNNGNTLHGGINGIDRVVWTVDNVTEVDSLLIPSGEIVSVKGTPFDFRTPTTIGKRINEENIQLKNGMGYDHNWVIDRQTEKEVELAASLNFRESVALETQKYPDSPNHANFPTTRLNPGEVYTQTCIYKFSVK